MPKKEKGPGKEKEEDKYRGRNGLYSCYLQ